MGAGVSGLTAAHDFIESGFDVLLVDDYADPGGNHISREFGPYTFDIGAIFFWQDSLLPTIFEGITRGWIPVKFDACRITPTGRVLRYPFDVKEELLAQSPRFIGKACLDVLRARAFGRRRRSALDFSKYYLGDTLLRTSGLGNYLRRFYGIPLDNISYEFARRRMGWIASNGSLHGQLRNRLLALKRHRAVEQSEINCNVRPRSGFAPMYRTAVDQLRAAGLVVRLDAGIERIARDGSGFVVIAGDDVYCAPRLVNTMPLVKLAALLNCLTDDLPESSALITLCCRFRGNRGFRGNVLYNFHDEGRWKRLTMHSDHYGMVDGWQYFAVEVTTRQVLECATELFADFRRSTANVGLFDGELDLVGDFRTDFAYPVFDREAAAKKAEIAQRIKALGVESVGRQGDFDYTPSANEAIALVRDAVGTETLRGKRAET